MHRADATFRKGEDGRYLWPGYGENMRVLKWVIERSVGRAGARETPIGYVPRLSDLDLRGIDADAHPGQGGCCDYLDDELAFQEQAHDQLKGPSALKAPALPNPRYRAG